MMFSMFRQSLSALHAPFFLLSVFVLPMTLVTCSPANAVFVLPPTSTPMKVRASGPDLVSDEVDDGIASQMIDIDLTWSHPTTNTDASALPLGNIIGYDIEHIRPLEPALVFTVGAVTSHTLTNVFRGTHLFRIRTYASNGTSAWSAQISVPVL